MTRSFDIPPLAMLRTDVGCARRSLPAQRHLDERVDGYAWVPAHVSSPHLTIPADRALHLNQLVRSHVEAR